MKPEAYGVMSRDFYKDSVAPVFLYMGWQTKFANMDRSDPPETCRLEAVYDKQGKSIAVLAVNEIIRSLSPDYHSATGESPPRSSRALWECPECGQRGKRLQDIPGTWYLCENMECGTGAFRGLEGLGSVPGNPLCPVCNRPGMIRGTGQPDGVKIYDCEYAGCKVGTYNADGEYMVKKPEQAEEPPRRAGFQCPGCGVHGRRQHQIPGDWYLCENAECATSVFSGDASASSGFETQPNRLLDDRLFNKPRSLPEIDALTQYIQAGITVQGSIMAQRLYPHFKAKGWVYQGTSYGNGSFVFSLVSDRDGKIVPYEDTLALLREHDIPHLITEADPVANPIPEQETENDKPGVLHVIPVEETRIDETTASEDSDDESGLHETIRKLAQNSGVAPIGCSMVLSDDNSLTATVKPAEGNRVFMMLVLGVNQIGVDCSTDQLCRFFNDLVLSLSSMVILTDRKALLHLIISLSIAGGFDTLEAAAMEFYSEEMEKTELEENTDDSEE